MLKIVECCVHQRVVVENALLMQNGGTFKCAFLVLDKDYQAGMHHVLSGCQLQPEHCF